VVQMIIRMIPLVLYCGVIVWAYTTDDDQKHVRLWMLQRKIEWHKARAKYHSDKWAHYDKEYKEVALV
jgi:hypothetical protein